jgi:glucose/arabinose dehydrogenase
MPRLTTILEALCLLSYLAVAVACGDGGSGTPPSSPSPPEGLSYAVAPGLYRVGESIAPNAASLAGGGTPTLFSVTPALPAGLLLDGDTGAIGGTPTSEASGTHTVTASNEAGSTQVDLDIHVGPALPGVFAALAPGYLADVVYEDPAPMPRKLGKIALAPDGRIFFTEVDTGDVRVIDPDAGGLQPTPFVDLTVLGGGHNGLLGLALAPDFTTSGHLYAMACLPAGGGHPDRMAILRWTDVANVGTNEQVVIDDLPVTPPMGVNNGGEIVFDASGHLFVSIGDVQDPPGAQADASVSLAGKVLRYDVSSLPPQVPASNPFAGSPEWVRGLRNTFGLAVHPTTGDLFGVDNGAAADDELNYLAPGKNFEWMNASPPPIVTGFKIRNYQTVVVPTGLCWHTGAGWGAAWQNDMLMTTYEDHTIVRFEMSGAAFTDIDEETEFARFVVTADDNHPLDVEVAADGSVYVSTFTGIYRITKQP